MQFQYNSDKSTATEAEARDSADATIARRAKAGVAETVLGIEIHKGYTRGPYTRGVLYTAVISVEFR